MAAAADARARYVREFEAAAGNGARQAPAWLRAVREGAIARFAEVGFPTLRQEEWRFTSVKPIADTVFSRADEPVPSGALATAMAPYLLCEADRHRAVFVNGHFMAALSSLAGLPEGVTVGSLAAALESDADLVQQHLARYARPAAGPFCALNAAFMLDGAFVFVPEGVDMEEPVQVLFLSSPSREPIVSHPRTLVVVERSARASIVESYAGGGEGVYWTNAVTEVVVGDGARADCYRVQRESGTAYHVATTHTHQGRDSVVWFHPVALGAALARHDIVCVLDGSGGLCTLNGLYLLGRQQHADHHTTIDHAQPHCESHEYFNGVLDDQSHGVFNGRIIVRPGAQRTDAKQTNNNLVLSGEARADSQPQLEIYADDVRCTHGATLGPLDERALFYLRSRGMSAGAARSLLTYGFGAEILGRMDIAPLRAQLDRLVRARLQRESRREDVP